MSSHALITLLTDLGEQDYFVGAVKGVILAINPGAVLVDACHQIPNHDVRSAAFTLYGYYSNYPKGTIHLAVVDPGVGSARRPLVVVTDDYLLVGPDNGIFSHVFSFDRVQSIHAIENAQYAREPVSNTFHGRDIFAPAAAWLSRGVRPADLGPEIDSPIAFKIASARELAANRWAGEVMHIDRFGNCVLSLRASQVAGLREGFELRLGGFKITAHHASYAAANPGQTFVYEGSAGFLEVALANQSAAEQLGVQPGSPFELTLPQ